MPMQRELYPAEWEAIALAVKEAAGWRCEVCGLRCRQPGEVFDTHKRTLTVMHLNHTPADCRPENLLAACSGCHLRYDGEHRRLRRLAKRREKREARMEPLEAKQERDG